MASWPPKWRKDEKNSTYLLRNSWTLILGFLVQMNASTTFTPDAWEWSGWHHFQMAIGLNCVLSPFMWVTQLFVTYCNGCGAPLIWGLQERRTIVIQGHNGVGDALGDMHCVAVWSTRKWYESQLWGPMIQLELIPALVAVLWEWGGVAATVWGVVWHWCQWHWCSMWQRRRKLQAVVSVTLGKAIHSGSQSKH